MKDFLTLAASRESCRSYDSTRPVEREKLEQCLQAAQLAPSARNSQPWSFVVVDTPEKCALVAQAVQYGGTGINKFASDCTAFILCQREILPVDGEREAAVGRSLDFTQLDLGIAVAHLCLAATDLGLSTCIMGWLDEATLREQLALPQGDLRVIVGMGYATTDTLRPKKRKELDDIRQFRD